MLSRGLPATVGKASRIPPVTLNVLPKLVGSPAPSHGSLQQQQQQQSTPGTAQCHKCQPSALPGAPQCTLLGWGGMQARGAGGGQENHCCRTPIKAAVPVMARGFRISCAAQKVLWNSVAFGFLQSKWGLVGAWANSHSKRRTPTALKGQGQALLYFKHMGKS